MNEISIEEEKNEKSFYAKYKFGIIGGSILIIIAIILGIVLGIYFNRSSSDDNTEPKTRSFTIDHENDTFLMDGKPFRYVAGAFHYFRALPQVWRERLRTMKTGGLNAVDLYVHWALHNPEDGVYNFEGIADVEKFIELATEEGFYIILRPGPYICAEIDNGGLPYWLATKYPDIELRTSDENYLFEIERWYAKLMPKFEKHFYGNGGNIIMVQVENEYGAYSACDEIYKEFLRDETLKYTKDSAVLFTVDWPYDKEITCGKIDNVFITVDFGRSTFEQVHEKFMKLREYQPTGPLVNTEFYPGWFSLYQGPHSVTNTTELANTLDHMLVLGANVDFYVYFGGTNFGFWAGADRGGIGSYMPDIQSYDYGACMDEAGNPTDKVAAFKEVIMGYIEVPELSIPEKKKTMALDALTMIPINSILSDEGREILGTRPVTSNSLLTFEEMKQFSGFLLYETELPKFTRDPANLVLTDLRDRALVYIDGEFIGVLSRENLINTLPISAEYGSKLSILVENQGRLNFGVTDDYKGIRGSVQVQSFDDSDKTYFNFNSWNITGFPFDKFVDLESLARVSDEYDIDSSGIATDGPTLFYSAFIIEENEEIFDTYWDTTDWGKGFIFINGFNLGRYWPIGPQITMYIPKELLQHGMNEIYIVELQKAPSNLQVNFVNGPIFINDKKV